MRRITAERGAGQQYVEWKRARLFAALERDASDAAEPPEPLPRERLEHLVGEAEELYSNELAWEELTDEEMVAGGRLTELVFPGFLTFVDGLLLNQAKEGAAAARPHPDAVEAILTFLGDRYADLGAELDAGADSGQAAWARTMTSRLIDLTLYRLYRLTPAEREELDAFE
jgi:hypothetical protein